MKVIIVGGVAGGASCAARLRRLDENAEIVMVERGPFVSQADRFRRRKEYEGAQALKCGSESGRAASGFQKGRSDESTKSPTGDFDVRSVRSRMPDLRQHAGHRRRQRPG